MGWEKRTRGGRYYTISKRVDGKVARHYVGTGPIAESIAAELEAARRKRAEEAAVWEAKTSDIQARDKVLTTFCRLADQVTAAVLITSGYHRHNRGEWRRKRNGNRRVSED